MCHCPSPKREKGGGKRYASGAILERERALVREKGNGAVGGGGISNRGCQTLIYSRTVEGGKKKLSLQNKQVKKGVEKKKKKR